MIDPRGKSGAVQSQRGSPQPDADPRARIYAVVRRIPAGRVSTYGWIAAVAGLPGRARLVGTCLRDTPPGVDLPWHRVVNAAGRLSLPPGSAAYEQQRQLLEREGVTFVGGRIRLDRWGWPEPTPDLDALLWGPTES